MIGDKIIGEADSMDHVMLELWIWLMGITVGAWALSRCKKCGLTVPYEQSVRQVMAVGQGGLTTRVLSRVICLRMCRDAV